MFDGNRLLNRIAGVAATVGDRVGSGYHNRAGSVRHIAVVHRHAICGAAVADAETRCHKFSHGRHRRRCRTCSATAHLNRCQRARDGRFHIVVDIIGEHPCRGKVCAILVTIGVGLLANTVLLARFPSHCLRRFSDRLKLIAALVFDDRQRSRCRSLVEAGHIGGRCHRTADLCRIHGMLDGNRLGDGFAGVAATVGDRVGSGYHNRAGAVHHIAVAYRHVLCGAAVIDGEVCRLKLGHGRHRRGIIHGTTAHLFCCQCTRDGRFHIVIDVVGECPRCGEICAVRVGVRVGLCAYAVLFIRLPSQRLCRIIVGIKHSAALVLDDRQCGGCYCLRQAGHIGGRCHRTIDFCGIHGVLDGNRLGNSTAGVAAAVGDRVGSGHHNRAGASHRIAVIHRHALCGAAVADAEARGHKFGHGFHRRWCRTCSATAHFNRCQRTRECRSYIVVDVIGEHPCLGLICTILIGVRVLLRTFAVRLAFFPSHCLRWVSDRGKRVSALVLDDRQRSWCRSLRQAGHIGGRCHRTADLCRRCRTVNGINIRPVVGVARAIREGIDVRHRALARRNRGGRRVAVLQLARKRVPAGICHRRQRGSHHLRGAVHRFASVSGHGKVCLIDVDGLVDRTTLTALIRHRVGSYDFDWACSRGRAVAAGHGKVRVRGAVVADRDAHSLEFGNRCLSRRLDTRRATFHIQRLQSARNRRRIHILHRHRPVRLRRTTLAVRHFQVHGIILVTGGGRDRGRHRMGGCGRGSGCGFGHRQVAAPHVGVVSRGDRAHSTSEFFRADVRTQLGHRRDAHARHRIDRHIGLAARDAVRGLVLGRHRHRVGACCGVAQCHRIRAGAAGHRGTRGGPCVVVVAGRARRGDGHRVVVQRRSGAQRGRGREVRHQRVVHRHRYVVRGRAAVAVRHCHRIGFVAGSGRFGRTT